MKTCEVVRRSSYSWRNGSYSKSVYVLSYQELSQIVGPIPEEREGKGVKSEFIVKGKNMTRVHIC